MEPTTRSSHPRQRIYVYIVRRLTMCLVVLCSNTKKESETDEAEAERRLRTRDLVEKGLEEDDAEAQARLEKKMEVGVFCTCIYIRISREREDDGASTRLENSIYVGALYQCECIYVCIYISHMHIFM